MIGTREAISIALFNLVSNSAGYVTKSRRIRLWTDVTPAEKPALFLVEAPGEDTERPGRGLPGKTIMNYLVFIYISSQNLGETVTGMTILNPLLDALDAALAPSPGGLDVQTLGGLVSHCWVEGQTLKDAADLEGNGLAVVPIKVLVP